MISCCPAFFAWSGCEGHESPLNRAEHLQTAARGGDAVYVVLMCAPVWVGGWVGVMYASSQCCQGESFMNSYGLLALLSGFSKLDLVMC